MTTTTVEQAKKIVGRVVNTDSDVWGTLEYVTADGWAGVRGPPEGPRGTGPRRLDEIQVGRIYPDPT